MSDLIPVYVYNVGPKPKGDGRNALINYLRSTVIPFDLLEKFRTRGAEVSALQVIEKDILPILKKTFSFIVQEISDPFECNKRILFYVRRKLYDLERERYETMQNLLTRREEETDKAQADNKLLGHLEDRKEAKVLDKPHTPNPEAKVSDKPQSTKDVPKTYSNIVIRREYTEPSHDIALGSNKEGEEIPQPVVVIKEEEDEDEVVFLECRAAPPAQKRLKPNTPVKSPSSAFMTLRSKHVSAGKTIPAPVGYTLLEGRKITRPSDYTHISDANHPPYFFGKFNYDSFKQHFTQLRKTVHKIIEDGKGKSISNPTKATLTMHKFWDNAIALKGDCADPVIDLFGGHGDSAECFRQEISNILTPHGYTTERFIIPAVVWNKASDKRSSLQDPHLDWASSHEFLPPSQRPLACVFPLDKDMLFQFWPSGPGFSHVVMLKLGELCFFDSTIVHGGVVCGGPRVHCYIAENMTDTVSVTKYAPDGALHSYRSVYEPSMILDK